eukprot:1457063-Alexandrium_andersonii.AAC.1
MTRVVFAGELEVFMVSISQAIAAGLGGATNGKHVSLIDMAEAFGALTGAKVEEMQAGADFK